MVFSVGNNVKNYTMLFLEDMHARGKYSLSDRDLLWNERTFFQVFDKDTFTLIKYPQQQAKRQDKAFIMFKHVSSEFCVSCRGGCRCLS